MLGRLLIDVDGRCVERLGTHDGVVLVMIKIDASVSTDGKKKMRVSNAVSVVDKATRPWEDEKKAIVT